MGANLAFDVATSADGASRRLPSTVPVPLRTHESDAMANEPAESPTPASTSMSSDTAAASDGPREAARDGAAHTTTDAIVVDAIGKACPMPVIDLATAVKPAPLGAVFHLLADDGTARVDVPIWCRMQRQRLDDVVEADGHVRFVVTKTTPTT